METKTILLVEDDPALALVQIHWLHKAGYKTIHVLSGESAIETVNDNSNIIDLILMDINLGKGIDGTKAAQEILKNKDIPVLFLSSHTEREVVEKTEKISSYGYVVKDSKDVVLLASINMAFKLYKAKNEVRAKQEELIESERNYFGVINSLTESIYILGEDSIFIDVNEGAVKMYGYTKEELIGQTPEFVSAPGKNDLNKVFILNQKVFRTGEKERFEFWGKRKNGEIFPKDVILNKGKYFGKDVVIAAARDITERKNNETALQISEEKHRSFLENLSDIAYELDIQKNLTYINKAAEIITGLKISDWLGKSILPLLTEESKILLKIGMEQTLAEGSSETELTLINGKVLNFKNKLKIDQNGNVTGTFGIGRDITERKQAEALNRHHTNEITNLYEVASDLADLQVDLKTLLQNIVNRAIILLKRTDGGIYLYDREKGDLVVTNATNPLKPIGYRLPMGEGMAGRVALTRKPMILDDYRNWEHHLPVYDGVPLTAVLEVPMLYRGELIGVLTVEEFGENARKFSEDDMRLLTIFAGQAAGAVHSARLFNDIQEKNKELQNRISDLDQKEEQLQKYASDLSISNATKDKFFSIIAHDLRSPFLGMMGLTDYIIEEIDSPNKISLKNNLGILKISLSQQFELLSDLLEWARLQIGNQATNPETVSINQIVKIVADPFILAAKRKDIQIINSIDDNIFVFADKVLLGIVMRNLISNGIKFTNENGTINISGARKGGYVEINVTDTGVGIPKEAIDKLFRIDIHLSTEGTSKEKGTGLGLILCKEIMEKSGGTIRVESEVDKGSTFILTLPIGA